MKVLLLDIKARDRRKCVNKDLAGGMGTGTWVGDSFLARIFEYTKKKSVVLPELTTAYLAAIFKKAGWTVERVSIEGESVKFPEADLAMVSSSIVDCDHELEVVGLLKQQRIKTGVYGTFATAKPDFYSGVADFVIRGESEAGALKIINEGIPAGIVDVEPVSDLNSLPFPDWSLFPIGDYSYSPVLNKKPVLLMLATRGCTYSCSFYCPYTINSGRRWRARSLDNVMEEVEYLKSAYDVRAVDFRDPIFILDRARTLDFCARMAAKNTGIIWSCETRLDRVDKELINVMYKAGLRHINMALHHNLWVNGTKRSG